MKPNNIKKIYISISLLLACIIVMAQGGINVSPRVFSTQGCSATGGNLQLQYTIGEPLNQTVTSGAYKFSLGFEQPEINVTVTTITDSIFCAGTTIKAPFKVSGIFATGNIFTAQLSDSSGSFASPLIIGADTGSVSDSITATVPSGGITGGTHYSIRVIASNPAIIGGRSSLLNIRKVIAPADIPVQVVNSDTTVPVGFKNIIALGQGNEIEWALNHNFDSSHILSSPANFYIPVNVSSFDSIWVRSRDSLSTCLSDSIFTTAKVFTIPVSIADSTDTLMCYGLNAPFVVTATLTPPYDFTVSIANSDSADQIEWSPNSYFTSSTIITPSGTPTGTISVADETTVWVRSKNSATGCVSRRVLQIMVPDH